MLTLKDRINTSSQLLLSALSAPPPPPPPVQASVFEAVSGSGAMAVAVTVVTR